MSSASSSKKRTASESQLDAGSGSNKVAKVHPFFTKANSKQESAPNGSLTWLKPFGGCLHAVNNTPKSATKVAAFDLDGTVIASLDFKVQNANPLRWHWWNDVVPTKLAQAANEGYALVIFSNQGALKSDLTIKKWKDKMALIAAAVPDLPFRLIAACRSDNFKYRKPNIGMWEALEQLFAQDGVQIDKTLSFFVGDAAGRHYPNNPKKKEFSSSDRKFALNVGIPFHTPEEYFLGQEPNPNFELNGLDVSSLASGPLFTPSLSPLVPNPPRKEIVLFVGYPSLGKTTFFRRHFEPAGYRHINQDTLKTRDKCIKAVRQELSEGAKSCVVDNTNRDAYTRRFYIDVAKEFGVPIRCMWFTGSLELAWHNNMYRAYGLPPSVAAREPSREVLPKIAFMQYRNDFEEPGLEEGFTEIKKINWVFDGTPEERKAWARWYLLFGKDSERFL